MERPKLVPARPTRRYRHPRNLSLAVSVVLAVVAPLSWWWSIDDPVLRSTAFSVWTLLGAALFLSISAAWRDRRPLVVGVVALQLAELALFAWAFFGLQRLPAASAPERAPDFTLSDEQGHPVTLSSELARGPRLLVFTRGHW